MRILILQDDFPPLNLGGAGTIAFAYARELVSRGHEVQVVTTVRSQNDTGTSEYQGLTMHKIWSSYDLRFQSHVSLWNPGVVRQVSEILTAFKPEVVHAHNVHGYLSYASLRAAKRSGARVILTCHDVMPFNYGKFVQYIDPSDLSIPHTFNYKINPWRQLRDERFRYNPLRNLLIRRTLSRYVDDVVAVSEALKDALEQNGVRNVKVIHNGIDTALWETSENEVAQFKDKYRLGNSVVLFSGKPVVVKGGRKLIEAMASCAQDVPDIQLLVLGREGKDTELLCKYAEEKGVADKLVFSGWLSGAELRAAYHASSLVTVPSLCFDSFPTMILEAFACKKPVIATCFGGSSEIVEDGVSGYIINPFDVKALSSKLHELLSDGKKAALFGDSGFNRIKQDFTLERGNMEYESLFTR